jgi:hypothetical protein
MNAFRCTPDRSLDRIYLRTCAIYRLLRQRRIGVARAEQLLLCPAHLRRALVELWRSGPLPDMQP